jgi:hypothetical protein
MSAFPSLTFVVCLTGYQFIFPFQTAVNTEYVETVAYYNCNSILLTPQTQHVQNARNRRGERRHGYDKGQADITSQCRS